MNKIVSISNALDTVEYNSIYRPQVRKKNPQFDLVTVSRSTDTEREGQAIWDKYLYSFKSTPKSPKLEKLIQ